MAFYGLISPLFVVYIDLMTGAVLGADTLRTREYCKWEMFNATCRRPDHVIIMRSARYGRMRFGRCMQEDHGSVGCSTDVLPVLDRKCSGRHTCQMTIPDASLHAVQMCPRELIPYLEASYDCVQVRVANRHTCAMFNGVPLRSHVGYLAVVSAVETTVGTAHCPWTFDMEHGQRVNLSVPSVGWSTSGSRTAECPLKLTIHDDNKTVTVPMCPQVNGLYDVDSNSALSSEKFQYGELENERSQHSTTIHYESEGRSIRVFITVQPSNDDNELSLAEYLELMGAFVIKYEVFGCADITWVPNAAVRRHGDQTVITCNSTGETFYVTCDSNRWPLHLINCTKSPGDRTSLRVNRSLILPRSVLSVIAIGMLIGICVGIAVLTVVLNCLHKSARMSEDTNSLESCSCRGRTKDPLLCPYSTSVASQYPSLYPSYELEGLPMHGTCGGRIRHKSIAGSQDSVIFTTADQILSSTCGDRQISLLTGDHAAASEHCGNGTERFTRLPGNDDLPLEESRPASYLNTDTGLHLNNADSAKQAASSSTLGVGGVPV